MRPLARAAVLYVVALVVTALVTSALAFFGRSLDEIMNRTA
jgi:hypothetical protein